MHYHSATCELNPQQSTVQAFKAHIHS